MVALEKFQPQIKKVFLRIVFMLISYYKQIECPKIPRVLRSRTEKVGGDGDGDSDGVSVGGRGGG